MVPMPPQKTSAEQRAHKRQLELLNEDAKRLCSTDINRPFRSLQDIVDRLLPFHMLHGLEPDEADREELQAEDHPELIMSRSHLVSQQIQLHSVEAVKKVDTARQRVDAAYQQYCPPPSQQPTLLPEDRLVIARALALEAAEQLRKERSKPPGWMTPSREEEEEAARREAAEAEAAAEKARQAKEEAAAAGQGEQEGQGEGAMGEDAVEAGEGVPKSEDGIAMLDETSRGEGGEEGPSEVADEDMEPGDEGEVDEGAELGDGEEGLGLGTEDGLVDEGEGEEGVGEGEEDLGEGEELLGEGDEGELQEGEEGYEVGEGEEGYEVGEGEGVDDGAYGDEGVVGGTYGEEGVVVDGAEGEYEDDVELSEEDGGMMDVDMGDGGAGWAGQ